MMKVIVAETRDHAAKTATIDWGWRPAPRGFTDGHGDYVRYIHSTEQLLGLERGSVKIYLGFGWYKNQGLKDLLNLASAREYQMLSAPD